MGHSVGIILLVFCIFQNGVFSIPASMVEEIKANELKSNKVKRVPLPAQTYEENVNNDNHYIENPTAIKRGIDLKSQDNDEESNSNNNWNSDEQNISNNDFPPSLYNEETSQFSRRDLNDLYGINREKLDEALENVVLKPELYNDGPSPTLNRYGGYLDMDIDEKKRKKRNSRNNYNNQFSSSDLTPKEVLELLALYESERYQNPKEISPDDFSEDNDETWLDVPVRPHSEPYHRSDIGPAYNLDQNIPSGLNSKYLMAAKKRNDPTRQIRYLTGPSKHDYYTLSQLLSNQRESNVPVYHRYVL